MKIPLEMKGFFIFGWWREWVQWEGWGLFWFGVFLSFSTSLDKKDAQVFLQFTTAGQDALVNNGTHTQQCKEFPGFGPSQLL